MADGGAASQPASIGFMASLVPAFPFTSCSKSISPPSVPPLVVPKALVPPNDMKSSF